LGEGGGLIEWSEGKEVEGCLKERKKNLCVRCVVAQEGIFFSGYFSKYYITSGINWRIWTDVWNVSPIAPDNRASETPNIFFYEFT